MKYTLWKEFSNIKYKEEIVSENASKPNPRFDRSTETDNDTTSEESIIKTEVKEL